MLDNLEERTKEYEDPGDITFKVYKKRVCFFIGGAEVGFRTTCMKGKTLNYLLENPGRVIPRKELFDAVGIKNASKANMVLAGLQEEFRLYSKTWRLQRAGTTCRLHRGTYEKLERGVFATPIE